MSPLMSKSAPALVAAAAAVCLTLGTSGAQNTQHQLWPELDGYWTWPSRALRLYALASVTRAEEANVQEGTLGIHLDYLGPPLALLRVGLRETQSLSSGSYEEHRLFAEATFPRTTGTIRFRNRATMELRWISGAPSQRYRDRMRVERQIMLRNGRDLLPYATFELYYDTRHRALSRTGYRLGGELAVDKHVRLDISSVRQDNRFSSPRHVDALSWRVALMY